MVGRTTAAEVASLRAALGAQRTGHALSRAFHTDPAIHAQELETIWRRSWLFAGPSADATGPGDFFRVDLGDDSMVVVRLQDGSLAALHNTCRHRGMPVCAEASGTARRWVCPYHQWSYALDGRLLGAGGTERELDLDGLDLLRVPVQEIGGLIYIWPDTESPPADFDAAARDLGAALARQGLDHARIAHRADYTVAANWKLVWENNRECWHCHAGHPEYVTANFDIAPDTAGTRELAETRAAEHAAVLAGGVSRIGDASRPERDSPSTDQHAEPGLYRFPTPGRWWSANRTPLRPGFVTESLDGQPVSSLMGSHPGYDVGTLRVRTVPNFWSHASSDHAVLTRLLPDGPDRTLISVYWLVAADADPDLERMLPFWQLTSEQDWALCEANHAGVRSPAYRPGPYSPSREYNVIAFSDWYLARMRAGLADDMMSS